ncbi:MAG: cellulase family glycosylhydrolase [Dysgonamonadaceae bacterium]|jgi:hypothetical protein|nr:cellulase family glycosylhydrolase [Dysgonamonadaceae bacterium]
MKLALSVLCTFIVFTVSVQCAETIPTINIDKNGIMRWSDNREEASFYGVNYTLPFAHAYRAIHYIGKNHKEAIDKDVYHFARLGFNAYRIHVWDVEISDSTGNLIENEHLDLLDYLIAKLQKRNIRILLTTMTNFGNGYPEKNQPTEGFSYLYDKCKIHSDKNAVLAQTNYIRQFVQHTNPYTGRSYKDDPYIIGFEINNEPCHAETPEQTKKYINQMLSALKKAGNTKAVFYNVSHNLSHVNAYYDTSIQGTTYQWYPSGLVAGHTRKGNFLPYVDDYHIPFSKISGFDKKTKAVYEFDPADIIGSYIYPAMARTFRSKGFQWITQFAYDPLDIAWANTEYQTHCLNLAYTPGKAISMKIAAEVAYTIPRHAPFEKYPNDTLFNNFHVSYLQNLSELNTPEKFFYSNRTTSLPVMPERLEEIAGCGNSPTVQYEGTGAYFLDRLEAGLWRLEVMPDAIQLCDPFGKTSLKKEALTVVWNTWNMKIELPDLGADFNITGVNTGNTYQNKSSDATFPIQPGVYLLKRAGHTSSHSWTPSTAWKNILLGEFAAPENRSKTCAVLHQPAKAAESNKPLLIEIQVIDSSFPDSVLLYTDKISFWYKNNPVLKMKRTHAYTYQVEVPANEIKEGFFKYTIVVFKNGKTRTFPANVEGNPLDWDYYTTEYWTIPVVNTENPIDLLTITDENSGLERYAIPEWSYMTASLNTKNRKEANLLDFKFTINAPDTRFIWRKYIKEQIEARQETLQKVRYLCLILKNTKGIERLKAGFVTSDGFTYTSVFKADSNADLIKIPLSELLPDKTNLLPSPYPVFLGRYFVPDAPIPFRTTAIETLEIATLDDLPQDAEISLGNVWLE